MIHELYNDLLKIVVQTKGAELKSVTDVKTGFEFMWQADPGIWGRTAPVLFPVVGKLKEDRLLVNGHSYPMTQHGFARDMEFILSESLPGKVVFVLKSGDQTRSCFPFDFELSVTYRLMQNSLTCEWEVRNPGKEDLWFSIGAHPGFNLVDADLLSYTVEFDQAEQAERNLLTGGLFNGNTGQVLTNSNRLALMPSLFEKDAIVLKDLLSDGLILRHGNSQHTVKMSFRGFPYLGIWSPKGCNSFVCLEPWFGLADSTGGHTDISEKEGIQQLMPGERFERAYRMRSSRHLSP